MQLSYRKLMTLGAGLEYAVVKTAGAESLCLQGILAQQKKIKRAISCAEDLGLNHPEYMPKFLSCSQQGPIASALFTHLDAGLMSDFLSSMPKVWHYASGRQAGRALSALQEGALTARQQEKALKRQMQFMERIADYVGNQPHFKGDYLALDAIAARHDHFTMFRPVLRYGMLRHDRLLVTREVEVKFLPSPFFGPGDVCEDFACLECQSAGRFPLFCAGFIDGYFKGRVPPGFWVTFAMQSALYAMWRLGRRVRQRQASLEHMQLKFDRIRADFEDFKKPVPLWYRAEEVRQIRLACQKKGL